MGELQVLPPLPLGLYMCLGVGVDIPKDIVTGSLNYTEKDGYLKILIGPIWDFDYFELSICH